jgi:CBS domain-containing protein
MLHEVRTIGALMNQAPRMIAPDDPLDLAEAVMRGTHARHWPVVRDRSLVGVLSLRDLLAAQAPAGAACIGRADQLRAYHIMSTASIVARPGDELVAVAEIMSRHHLSTLPVVRDEELLGVVTIDHLVEEAVLLLRDEERELGVAPIVARLMTYAPLYTIQLLERADVAQAIMQRFQVRHLPVLRDQQLVGMLSDRDLLGALRSSLDPASAILVGEVMTQGLETATTDADAAEAGAVLIDRRIGALPVLRQDRLAGILTKGDFLRYLVAMAPSTRRHTLAQRPKGTFRQ